MINSNQHSGTSYRGRFAPSPTGPLHFGSLVAAAASYLQARQNHGKWLVRIEDIDPPREIAGASDLILKTLEEFGFEWDEQLLYQSRHMSRYRDVLAELQEKKLVYPCTCSRREIRDAIAASGGPANVYPGTCRVHPPDPDKPCNWRLAVPLDTTHCFEDKIQGQQCVHFGQDEGDFAVWRKDDLPNYQLAVTIDDHFQSITEIVRGADLLSDTAGQNLLRDHLGYSQPQFMHIPMLVDAAGYKLSKQTGAKAINAAHTQPLLCAAFRALQMQPEPALHDADLIDLWQWAIQAWDYKRLNNITNVEDVSAQSP